MANVLVLESRDGDKVLDQAIVISMDTVVIREPFSAAFKQAMAKAASEVDFNKVILARPRIPIPPLPGRTASASRTIECHAAVEKYNAFAAEKMAAAAAAAWKNRQPGKFSFGLGHAVVAYNRRAVCTNGKADGVKKSIEFLDAQAMRLAKLAL